eukprot:TRINITY_DN3003_c0_g1_i1.p1 TRINITY_DN3003_c0_g1~~TRINITY_DN3003_c0_g1_i1.p1  ORF type:complete len:946 (-),score=166.47 TRINITY_DN3003_c0_g1_i1:425-3262(-)
MGTKVDALFAEWDNGKTMSENMDTLKQSQKSEEEIKIFTLPEDLSEFDRLVLLIESPHAIQKTSAIQSIPGIYKQYQRPMLDKVFPKILKDSYVLSLESALQAMLGESLTLCLQAKTSSPKQIMDSFFPCITNILQARIEYDVLNAWISSLVAAVQNLPLEILKPKILDYVLQKSDLTSPVSSRVAASVLMGTLAERLDSQTISASLFKRVIMLCQDTDYKVRSAICNQLNKIAKCVGPELAQAELVEEIQELLGDEEVTVKNAAYLALVSLADFFDRKTRREIIIPMLRKICQNPAEDMVSTICKSFGDMMTRISVDLEDDEDAVAFYTFFKSSAKRSDHESRKNAAANLPMTIKGTGPKKYAGHFHETLCLLARDDYAIVRKTVAGGLHEIASALGKERSGKFLKDSFIFLLQDDSLDVKYALTENMDTLLGMFAALSEEQKALIYSELLPMILEFISSMSKNWRATHALLTQLTNLADYYSNDVIYESFVPLMMKMMEDGPQLVKEAAARNLCIYLRRNKKNYQRSAICTQIIQRFAKKKSCFYRLVYIDICLVLFELFSRKFFRDNFFEATIELARDPVVNVRFKYCRVVPGLRRLFRGSIDDSCLKRIDDGLDMLMNDKDRDVSEAAKLTYKEVQLDITRPITSPTSDTTDKKKEDEEKAITGMDLSEFDDPRRRDMDLEKNRSEFRKRFVDGDTQGQKSKLIPSKPPGKIPSSNSSRTSLPGAESSESRMSASKLQLPGPIKKPALSSPGSMGLSSSSNPGTMSNSPSMSSVTSSGSSLSSSSSLFAGQNKSLKPLGAISPPSQSNGSSFSLPLGKLPPRETEFPTPKGKGNTLKSLESSPRPPGALTGTLPSVPSASARPVLKPTAPDSARRGGGLSSSSTPAPGSASSSAALSSPLISGGMSAKGDRSQAVGVSNYAHVAQSYDSAIGSVGGRSRRY